jgi:hypothetical protein
MERVTIARAIRSTWGEKTAWDELDPRRQQPWLEMADSVLAAKESEMEKPSRLVDDWRNVWRWWSVRFNALGLAILAWVSIDPVSVLYVWSLLPDDVRAILPPGFPLYIGIGLFALSMLARVVKQKPHGE